MKRFCRSKTAWVVIITVVGLIAILVSAATISYTTVMISHPEEIPDNLSVKNIISGKANRNSDKYNFLLMGSDSSAALCDVIILASLDTSENSLSIVQIPRDTYAEYTDGSYKKINGAPHRLGNDGFVSFLEKNMGIGIDYYVHITLDTLKKLVDGIGGIDVNVPVDMDYDDDYQNLHIHLKAGMNTLDGAQAEQFVRFRSGYTDADLGRMDAQKIFMTAVFDKFSNGISVKTMVGAATALIGNTDTNLTLTDICRFASYASEIDMDSVTFMTLPGSPAIAEQSGAGYYVLNRAATINMINSYINVKKTDVTDSKFDVNRVFENENYDDFTGIYNSSEYNVRIYSASDIRNGSIQLKQTGVGPYIKDL